MVDKKKWANPELKAIPLSGWASHGIESETTDNWFQEKKTIERVDEIVKKVPAASSSEIVFADTVVEGSSLLLFAHHLLQRNPTQKLKLVGVKKPCILLHFVSQMMKRLRVEVVVPFVNSTMSGRVSYRSMM